MNTRMQWKKIFLIRFLMIIPTIFILATMVFVIMRVIPGDPVVALMGGQAGSEEQIEIIRHSLGLDKPIHIQYLNYFSNLVKGDLGLSFTRNRPVIEEILSFFPATIELTLGSMLVGIPLGLYLGITAARREKEKVDIIIRIVSLIRWCIPVFWFGIMLQVFIVIYTISLPISGRLDLRIALDKITGLYVVDSILTGNTAAFIDSLKHLFLPTITLGTSVAASLTRITRSNIIEVLDEEYIKIVRLKGCNEKLVFQKHALPNALIPILTYTSLQIAMLMGGAMLTETTFSWPGLGRLLLFAVGYRDFNLIQGCVIFWAVIISLTYSIVDILYVVIDPRIEY